MPAGAAVYHVAAGPQQPDSSRRVYAVGPNQFWYSPDGGTQWFKDLSSGLPIDPNVPYGDAPYDCCASSAEVLAVEPGHPEHVFLAMRGLANGPAYFSGGDPQDGAPCNTPAKTVCGEGSIWLGDYSGFKVNGAAVTGAAAWRQLQGPPIYFGNGNSGAVFVQIRPLPDGSYLLFFSDLNSVHVSEGMPTSSASWHRLGGFDASDDYLFHQSNTPQVHVDPHAIATTADFNIQLKTATTPSPYNHNSVLNKFISGIIWMANDGGVAFSDNGGNIWSRALSGLSTIQVNHVFAALSLPGKSEPALYFGVPDNGSFFTRGGDAWGVPSSYYCGDCDAWVSDPAQTNRVLQFNARGGGFFL